MKKQTWLSFLLILFSPFILAQSTSVFDANYFDKDDNMTPPIKVGKGFHINDIYKQTRSCFTAESSNSSKLTPQQQGGKKTSLKFFYTKSNKEYNELRKTGASGKISFLNLFSLGGQKLKEMTESTSAEYERLIFTANIDFGSSSFEEDPTLTEEAKALIGQNKLQDFVKLYGTHYISGIRKESSITVILTRLTSSRTVGNAGSNSAQSKANIPYKGTGSLEISDKKWINDKLQKGSFTVTAEIHGPAINAGSIEKRVVEEMKNQSSDKSVSISEIINDEIKNISDPNQGLITQYYYSPFSLYGLEGIYWDERKQNELAKINESILKVYSAKLDLEQCESESTLEQFRNNFFPNNHEQELTEKYRELVPKLTPLNQKAERYLKELEKRYNNCSDVYCPSSSSCCDNSNIMSEIGNFDVEEEIQNILVNPLVQMVANIIEKESTPECMKTQKGMIVVKNLSSNPYDLYAGNKFIETLYGNRTKTFRVNMGNYTIKAIQKSGYLMYPTENLRSTSITRACQEVIFNIGFED